MEDLISIIVPVYNAEKYIEKTINCVLAQSYTNWELIPVVDCCRDNTEQVLKDLLERLKDDRIRAIFQETNTGAAGARNNGLAASRGRYIAYLDADDVWKSDKLEKELDFLKKNKAAFVFTGYEFGDENAVGTGKVVKVPETLSYKQALNNTTIFTSTVMFDTAVIPKSELNMPEIKSEDTALWWRVLRSGHLAYGLNENLVIYRRPATSLSSNKLEAVRRIWNLYRKAEGLNVFASAYHFFFWAIRAVKRRV